MSLFGQTQPSFGASPFQTPAFGASSASTATSSFGGFNTQQSSGGLFGAGGRSHGGTLFGGQSSAAGFGASSSSLFGATPLSPAPTFGANTQPLALTTTPAFGAPTTQPSLFGGTATAQPFGAGAQQTTPAMQNQLMDLGAVRELDALAKQVVAPSATGAVGSQYRFQHYFLNVLNRQPVVTDKSADVDEVMWREALNRANAIGGKQKLYPVRAQGFQDLFDRASEQQRVVTSLTTCVDKYQHMCSGLSNRLQGDCELRLQRIKTHYEQLAARLLQIVKQTDLLEGKYAEAQGQQIQDNDAMTKMSQSINKLQHSLDTNNQQGLGARAVELLEGSQRRIELSMNRGPTSDGHVQLSQMSQNQLEAALQQVTEVLKTLQKVQSEDIHDTYLAQQEIQGGGPRDTAFRITTT